MMMMMMLLSCASYPCKRVTMIRVRFAQFHLTSLRIDRFFFFFFFCCKSLIGLLFLNWYLNCIFSYLFFRQLFNRFFFSCLFFSLGKQCPMNSQFGIWSDVNRLGIYFGAVIRPKWNSDVTLKYWNMKKIRTNTNATMIHEQRQPPIDWQMLLLCVPHASVRLQ